MTSYTSTQPQHQASSSPAASPASSPASSPSASPASSPSASPTTSPSPSPASSKSARSASSVTSTPTSPSAKPASSKSVGSFSPVTSTSASPSTGSAPSPSTNPTTVPSYFEEFRVCAAKNTTRGQIATLNLPPVLQIEDDDIQLVIGPDRINNPLQLAVRPSESALTKGYRLINGANEQDSDDEELDVAVKMGDLGVFDCRELDIWTRASKGASIKCRVREEENWLCSSGGTLTATQIQEMGALLFDSEPTQEILRICNVFVDANELSSLAGEMPHRLFDRCCLSEIQ